MNNYVQRDANNLPIEHLENCVSAIILGQSHVNSSKSQCFQYSAHPPRKQLQIDMLSEYLYPFLEKEATQLRVKLMAITKGHNGLVICEHI